MIAAMMMASAAAAPLPGSHLNIMSFNDFDPVAQMGWVNLGLGAFEGHRSYPANSSAMGLAGSVNAFNDFGIPSLYYMQAEKDQNAIWKVGFGLIDGWEAAVERAVGRFRPYYGPGKAIRGVDLGDEMCCRNVTCWDQYVPYTAKLRQLLGPDAILYANECWLGDTAAVTIAPEFSHFSVDTYQYDYRQKGVGEREVAQVKSAYNYLFTRMHPAQQVLIVAGTFACTSNSSVGKSVPVDGGQTDEVLAKVNGLYEWAQSERRVAGFAPWHFNNRGGNQAQGASCDMRLGAEAMPKVVQRLREIGSAIISQGRLA